MTELTSAENLAARLTPAIAAGIPEITSEDMSARLVARERALTALRTFDGPAEMPFMEVFNRAEALDGLILEKLGDEDTAEATANAACTALVGELAQAGISDADFSVLTGRWFEAFEHAA